MHIGLLHGADARLAEAVAAGLLADDPSLTLTFNAPYAIDDASDYAVPVHGLARGSPNLLVEIRQDLISTAEGQAAWAARLFAALTGPAVTRLQQEMNA